VLLRILTLLLAILLSFGTGAANQAPDVPLLWPMKAQPAAPAMTLPDLNGASRTLADYRGSVVVINFWSTWCAPCRREMPSLERAWQRLQPLGIQVIGVAIQDHPEMIGLFLKDHPVSFPILRDESGEASAEWPFSGIPATFVLDREGRIVYRAMGMREWDSDAVLAPIIELSGGAGEGDSAPSMPPAPAVPDSE
jgi:peroxiredoxin